MTTILFSLVLLLTVTATLLTWAAGDRFNAMPRRLPRQHRAEARRDAATPRRTAFHRAA